ncbi:hypothetical protein VTI28DRAFT_8018 [Corynascus sepedonium]
MRAPAICLKTLFAPALVLLGLHALGAHGSRAGSETAVTAAPPAVTDDVCESRTINYITHTLPQQCLRTSWTSPSPTATDNPTVHASAITTTATAVTESTTADPENGVAQEQAQDAQEELAASSFMSFEEWKEMMLRKSGQDPASIKSHKQREHRERDPNMHNGDVDSFGEEGEISLEFDALAEKVSEITSSTDKAAPKVKDAVQEEQIFYDDGKTQYYRSKDAGKTCKERFSYSSFDAGATVLKTSPGAKNAKAILVENKDSYMLLECRAKNKFVIVELSDDILVDTVVLANFEFFSSMIRKFRVSVSDRYPVKLDKWVDLGTFEARNSRDMQAFLIEHPQIYTKYIRIEFLSHWGNEFYCPVSLLRVHGTRMLDTWKEPSHDDEPEQIESTQEPVPETQQVQEPVGNDNASVAGEEPAMPHASMEMGLTPWRPLFQGNFSLHVCELRSATTIEPTPVESDPTKPAKQPAAEPNSVTSRPPPASAVDEETQANNHAPSEPAASSEASASQRQSAGSTPSSVPTTAPQASNDGAGSRTGQKQSDGRSNATDQSSSTTATTPRNRTSAASSASASPTVQESFFKTITKRLQLLESNTSLSMQYIEEQSRFLQDVLLKMERKQITRVDSFLDTLNKTVLSELHNVRTQYDQIWQSTVLALETQREQSQREIVALTSRLNVLADEVVFQKRMAILQSVLLLSCLVLVIFSSRGGLAALDGTAFPPPLLTSSPPGYRRYGHTRSESLSGLSMPGSPPPQGHQTNSAGSNFGTVANNMNNINGLATSALQRPQTYQTTASYKNKSLPLTPPSEYSRESTPATHLNRSPGSSSPYYVDKQEERDDEEEEEDAQGRGEGEEARGERRTPSHQRQREQRHGTGTIVSGSSAAAPPAVGPSSDADADAEIASTKSDPGLPQRSDSTPSPSKVGNQQSEEPEPEDQGSPPLSNARPTMSQPSGSIRKPLPALPEDPS